MKGTSKSQLPHLRPAHPHLRVRGWFLSENAAMPPGQQVKVHKIASFVDILKVCKFTTFCDRKGYTVCAKMLTHAVKLRDAWAARVVAPLNIVVCRYCSEIAQQN